MTHRERFRMVLRGEMPDRIPVVCRLDIWHQAARARGRLPPDLRDKTLEQIQLDLDMGLSARGAKVFRVSYRNGVELIERREGGRIVEEWRTGRGTLRAVKEWRPEDEAAGIRPLLVEHPIKSLADYAIFEEIMRNRVYEPDYESYRQYDRQIGENGLPLVILNVIPVHEILLYWTGYEAGCEQLYTDPSVIEHAIQVANETHRRMWEVVAQSPCELVLYGAHYDTGMTPPPMFRKHFLPVVQAFNARLHQAGKWTVFHGDADLRLLLDLVLESGYDVIDCCATEPVVGCTFRQIREKTADRLTIWGGIPSILLEPPYTEAQLQQHIEMLGVQGGSGRRFIVGLSDQAMPGSDFRRIRQIADFFQKKGPVSLG